MHYKNILANFLSVLFLLSCSEESKLIFNETDFSNDENAVVEVIIPMASGNDNTVVNTINSTLSSYVIKSLKIGDQETPNAKTIEEGIANFNADFESFKNGFPEALPWDAQIDGEVMYQSPEIISISLSAYLNTGGAHGNLTITFLNFDAVTGKLIKNEGLFNNMNAFKKIAQTNFDDTIEDKNVLFDPQSFQLPENIGFNEEGIILLYNTYEVAPYATGIIEFTIPFNEVSTYLNFNGS
ncbi:DUF3298 and DUF4163 domain-containing protein [Flavobacteriaceae bacterium XHP0103]|nr:DUF3298 and DUF4163 domain-containing protein [Marixanthotalea marina]